MTVLVACAFVLGYVNHVHAASTTQPAITVSTLKLSDAVDLEQLSPDVEDATLTRQLHLSQGGHIFFGEIDAFDDDDNVIASRPIIARKVHGHFKAITIDDSRLKDAAWVYVGAGPNRGEVWGVLDASLKEDQADLVTVHSIDGGATFNIDSIRKPDKSADFDSFCIGPDQKGRVTVYLSTKSAEGPSKPGYYHFRTSDGGKTWSAPEFEPDAITPAKEVPDKDQPTGNKLEDQRASAHLVPSPSGRGLG